MARSGLGYRPRGQEFVAHKLLEWIVDQGIETALIELGKPWQNGATESFKGKFRDEGLRQKRCCRSEPISLRLRSSCPLESPSNRPPQTPATASRRRARSRCAWPRPRASRLPRAACCRCTATGSRRAPGKDAYQHFGITAEAIVETAKALL